MLFTGHQLLSVMWDSRKYPYHPHGRLLDILRWRGWGVSKAKVFEGKCKVIYWNFHRGWGGGSQMKNLSLEGYGYFLEQQNNKLSIIARCLQGRS